MSRTSVICRRTPTCVTGFPKAENKIKCIYRNNGQKFSEVDEINKSK